MATAITREEARAIAFNSPRVSLYAFAATGTIHSEEQRARLVAELRASRSESPEADQARSLDALEAYVLRAPIETEH